MKKFNQNIILFVCVIAFILYGFGGYLFDLKKGVSTLYEEKEYLLETRDIQGTLARLSDNDLWYHDSLVDLNSVRINLLNNRIAEKDDGSVIKTNNGDLSFYTKKITGQDELNGLIGEIKTIRESAESNDCGFLYVAVPKKEQFEQFPSNITDHSNTDYDHLLDRLNRNGIPYLDCKQVLKDSGIRQEDWYFITDHHWKPYCGFVVAESICKQLSELYSFSYDEEKADIKNYDIEVYEDYFLGSQGKKVGQFFTWKGVDDFELITPRFDTDFSEKIPYAGIEREGSFSETLLHKEHLIKNLHHSEVYETYSGGNTRLQIFHNNQISDGKKILIIRTSYASVVTPFLALQAEELHIVDNREADYLSGPIVDVPEYIKEIKPDYVIVLE